MKGDYYGLQSKKQHKSSSSSISSSKKEVEIVVIKKLADRDVSPYLECFQKLEAQIQWTTYGHKSRQAGMQYLDGEDEWTSAIGKRDRNKMEASYVLTTSLFKGTILEEFMQEFNLSRARLMWVEPFSTYSMHTDASPRIHLPLITNPNCYFVFKEEQVIEHMPINGIYWVDTVKLHTFINCSGDPRLHIVGCCH